MTGRVLLIGNVEEIPSKSGGEPFKKRVVVLNCTHSNYGDVYENYPSFEFSGRHVDDPAAFAVGEIVTISFALQGTKYQKSANDPVKYFNTISGYKIEKYQRGGQTQQQAPLPLQPQGVQSPAPQPGKDDDLPF
jgi:hypothetical protein